MDEDNYEDGNVPGEGDVGPPNPGNDDSFNRPGTTFVHLESE